MGSDNGLAVRLRIDPRQPEAEALLAGDLSGHSREAIDALIGAAAAARPDQERHAGAARGEQAEPEVAARGLGRVEPASGAQAVGATVGRPGITADEVRTTFHPGPE